MRSRIFVHAGLLGLMVVVSGVLRLQSDGNILSVGDRKQLFIDHRFIAASENIQLTVNPPVKLEKPVIVSDRPWEAFRFAYHSVADDSGLYKMWYSAFDGDQWGQGEQRGKVLVCYAESRDGLHWEKPNLGLVEYKGSKQNNIILDKGFSMKTMSVFIDRHAPPEKRYKMLYDEPSANYSDKRVATSADGLRWNFPHVASLKHKEDTQHVAFWDTRIKKYVVYIRVRINEDGTPAYPVVEAIASNPPVVAPKRFRPIRALGRLEMDDITQPWPIEKMRTVVAADEHDPDDSDIYTHGPYPYPYADDAYFLFPMTYQHFRETESTVGNDGVNDTQFLASRDGIHWMRYDRQPYLRRGLVGESDGGQIISMGYTIRRGNYLYQYYSNWPYTHGGFRRLSDHERADRSKTWGLAQYRVAVQRLDGYVSADASYQGGWILTPPLVFKGSRLELNIDVSAMGQAQEQVEQPDGTAVPGYSLSDCDRILMNDVAQVVRWKGKSDVSGLAEKPVRLRIAMTSAKLFAFQFR